MLIRGKASIEALIYAAAAVDCEGSITLMRHVSSKGYHSSGIVVSVANINGDFIKFFVDSFGGKVLEEAPVKLSKRVIYRWKVYFHGAAEFLTLIRPYMRIKGRQADLAIWFMAHKKDLTYQQRDECWIEMKALNKGEPPAETKRIEAGSNLSSDSPILAPSQKMEERRIPHSYQ